MPDVFLLPLSPFSLLVPEVQVAPDDSILVALDNVRSFSRDFKTLNWQFTAPNNLPLGVGLEPPRLTLGEDQVFVASVGILYAVDLASGKLQWQRVIGPSAKTELLAPVAFLPAAPDGSFPAMVFATDDRSVFGLRASDGTQLWQRRAFTAIGGGTDLVVSAVAGPVQPTQGSSDDPASPLPGGIVFATNNVARDTINFALEGFDPSTGNLVYFPSLFMLGISTRPVFLGGWMFIAGLEQPGHAGEPIRRVFGLSLANLAATAEGPAPFLRFDVNFPDPGPGRFDSPVAVLLGLNADPASPSFCWSSSSGELFFQQAPGAQPQRVPVSRTAPSAPIAYFNDDGEGRAFLVGDTPAGSPFAAGTLVALPIGARSAVLLHGPQPALLDRTDPLQPPAVRGHLGPRRRRRRIRLLVRSQLPLTYDRPSGPEGCSAMPHAPIPGSPLDSLDRLRARTKMMVEDYDVTVGAKPTRPTFRTQFSLADANGTPAPGDKLQLWASEPLAVTVDGQTVTLPTQPEGAPSFTANTMGLVSVTYSGDEIRAPFLFARTAAVPDFGTVPDYEVLNILSGVQPAGLAPETARGYDGMPLLPAKFQDEKSRTAIASAVRNSIGRVPQNAMMTSLFLAGGSLAPFSAPASRAVSPNDILHWSLDLGDEVTFMPSDTELITQAQAALAGFNLLGRLKEFVRDVVKGAKKLTRVVTMWAKDAVTFLCQVAEGFYMFVVNTIDDAVNVARAIFQRIVATVERVIEWLSFLFQWDDILRTQGAIADSITSALQTFRTVVETQLANGAMDVRSFFQARERDIESLFSQVMSQGGDTFASGTRGAATENPFAAGGQDSSVQINWLMERAMVGGPMAADGPAFGTLPNADDLLTRLSQFGDSARTMLAANPATQDLENRFQTVLQNLGRLLRNFPNFASLAANDLLGAIADLAVLTMSAADLLIEGFLELLRDVIDTIVTTLTQPIPIPFLSDLFFGLTKRPLTPVELGAFLIAVPTTILYKALFGQAPIPAGTAAFSALTLPAWGTIALSMGLLVRSVTEGLNDTAIFSGAFAAVVGTVNLGVGAALWGIKAVLAVMLSPNKSLSIEDTLLLLAGLVPTALGVAWLRASPEVRAAAKAAFPFELTFYGLFLIAVHTSLAALGFAGVPNQKKYATNFLANVTGDTPVASKALVNFVVDGIQFGRVAVVGVDFAGNLLSGIFLRLQWPRGSSSLVLA